MQVQFTGAAREVTGSCHIVRAGGTAVALDCGLFQGRRADARAKNEQLPADPHEIDAVVLSHAHIDHAGRLPFLVARGFRGPIYCTPATRDLCAIMLADSAHIQNQDAQHLERHGRAHQVPLYGQRDVVQTISQMVSVSYGRAVDVAHGMRAMFTDAGHILGSASVALDVAEDGATRRIVFSGDIGRRGLPIIRDPSPPEGAHAVIIESTYGDRDHLSVENARREFARVVNETAARGGKILVPAFAVGRTQELVYDLHALLDAGAVARIPIYVDSPLATAATGVFEMHPDAYDQTEEGVRTLERLFRNDLVRYVRDTAESKKLNSLVGPAIIIAASGMAESGRILHHLLHGAGDPRNTVLIVGFQAEHTLGRRIVERQPLLRILGMDVPLKARVEIINGYSAHGDRTELLAWLERVRAASPSFGPVWLVHGEPAAQTAFGALIGSRGFSSHAPERWETQSL
ncbi:MAG TPA: MBL fold metallo-hydrolase [Gemmatimonadaceae bacterium]|nr:MBL fold metallo-hydrolase [Gemmatimonadaceae bacterium]